jgi:hypothetical protein
LARTSGFSYRLDIRVVVDVKNLTPNPFPSGKGNRMRESNLFPSGKGNRMRESNPFP